ncbi:MAG: hypothetical protein ACE5GZ_07100 [Gammaproteobacteria bacterium]
MELHKIGIKLFAEESKRVSLDEFIPLFHRWIQEDLLEDTLVDVTNYSHVFAGPGTLLIAHEGTYGYDESGGRRGLIYYNKHKLNGSLPDRLVTIGRRALQACQLIERSDELKNRIRFPGGELLLFSNDRLAAPNTEETYQTMRPDLEIFLERLCPGGAYEIERAADPRERFALTVKVAEAAEIDEMLTRLSA